MPVIIASGAALRKLMEQGAATLPIFNQYDLYRQLQSFIPEEVLDPLLQYADSLTLVMWDSGVQILIFLAGLQTISPSLYEAAKMDGATEWEVFWKITFPMLTPMIFVNTLYSIVNSFTKPDNGVMNHLLNVVFVSNNYAYGSAIGWLYFIFIFIFLGLVFLIFRRGLASSEGGKNIMDTPNIRVVQAVVNKIDVDKKALYMRNVKKIVGNTFYYVLLLSLSFVFIYPLLYMVSQSFMRAQDVADATVQWLPKVFTFENYIEAFKSINYWKGLLNSIWIAFGSAILQIISCSFIGYGFARYRFPGKALWMGLLIFTFLVPPQTIVVPLYIFFSDLNWINTLYPFIFPSIFGFGLKGALFVLIFIQFYRGLPTVFEEAAKIDGAGTIPYILDNYVPACEISDDCCLPVFSRLELE